MIPRRPVGTPSRWPCCVVRGRPGENLYRTYDRDRIGFLRRCHDQYGDTFRFADDTLVTCDPKLIRSALVRTNTGFFAEESMTYRATTDAQRLQDKVSTWMAGRHGSAHNFSRAAGEWHNQRVVEILHDTLRRPEVASGRHPVLMSMTDFASMAVADYCLSDDAQRYHRQATKTTQAAVLLMDRSRLLPSWLPIGMGRRYYKAEHAAQQVMADIVRGRRNEPHPANRDVLDSLLSQDSPPLTDHQISVTLRVIMGAAFGVPGAALTWSILNLIKMPTWQIQLAEEQRRTDSHIDLMRQRPLAVAFVKEILRLYTPTWLMARHVIQDTVLGEVQLPAGAAVMFSPLIVHRDPRWWSEPEAFRPDRWLPTADPTRQALTKGAEGNSRTYLPFGAGPRVCLGAHLGTAHLVLALSEIASSYRIDPIECNDAASPGALLIPTALRCSFTFR